MSDSSKKRAASSLTSYFPASGATVPASASASSTASPSPSQPAIKKQRVIHNDDEDESMSDPFAFDLDADSNAPHTGRVSLSASSSSSPSKHTQHQYQHQHQHNRASNPTANSLSSLSSPSPANATKHKSPSKQSDVSSRAPSSTSKSPSYAAPSSSSFASSSSSSRMLIDEEEDDGESEIDLTSPPAAAATAAPSSNKSNKPSSTAALRALASELTASAAKATHASNNDETKSKRDKTTKVESSAERNSAKAEKEKEKEKEVERAKPIKQENKSIPSSGRQSSAGTSTAAASSSTLARTTSIVGGKKPTMSRKKKAEEEKRAAEALAAKMSLSVDEVLSKVSELKRQILTEESKYVRGAKRLTLADLDLPNVKTEVQSLNDDEVRAAIERVMIESVQSIIQGNGFHYEVPVRTNANQLYVPELDRIVLKDKVSERVFANIKQGRKAAIMTRIMSLVYELCVKKIHVTKRDLFYTDVKLFIKQENSDEVIEDVACMLGCTRTSLNVVASEKGIVVGRISFRDDGDLIDCTKMGVGGKAIPPSIDRITDIKGDAKFVLLVEKDAAFMRLAEDRFYNKYPCVIITAKGQPDVATRQFLKKVKETLQLPVLGLVDADPYGLKILSVYMSGSKNMSYDSASLTTPDIKWLGIRPSDLNRYNIPEQCRLPMTETDIKTGKELLEEEFIQKNPEWMKELQIMVDSKEKAEIQALSSFGFRFLSDVYLPQKLVSMVPGLVDPFAPHAAAARRR